MVRRLAMLSMTIRVAGQKVLNPQICVPSIFPGIFCSHMAASLLS